MDYRLLDCGDTAFTIEFGDRVDPALLAHVNALDATLGEMLTAGQLPGVVELVPTFRSLTVIYNPLETSRAKLESTVQPLLWAAETAPARPARHWRLPVAYGGDAGPDLDDVARACGMPPEAVIATHEATEYVVYMLGFLPGFPFMGDLPAPLQLPRRTEPRVRVPAGSVAIATGLTAIYPWESPGGWHLIGRCPIPLFDARQNPPALLAPGDRVRFQSIAPGDYIRLERDAAAGTLSPARWQLSPDQLAAQP